MCCVRCNTLENPLPMRLGNAIKMLRKTAGLTLDQVADLAGTTKSSVSRIETGEQTPSIDMLERIAAALGVRVYQIFAVAENVTLPVAKVSAQEKTLLMEFKAMEPEVQGHYLAIAKSLASGSQQQEK